MTQKIHRYVARGQMLCGQSLKHYTATKYPGAITCEKCKAIEAKKDEVGRPVFKPVITISWEAFVKKYKPIKNQFSTGAAVEGYMFETYGKELEEVRKHKQGYIWTLKDDNEGDPMYIENGAHWVNRLGYIITEIPWTNNNQRIIVRQ